MNFSDLRKASETIHTTKGLYEKEALIHIVLQRCEPNERIPAAMMLTGKLSTAQEGLTTGIKEAFIAKDLALEGRQSLEAIADVAILRAQCVSPPWLVIEVWEKFRRYLEKGDRTNAAKSAIINDVLFHMVEFEADVPFLLQILCEKVSNGVGDIMVVQALLHDVNRDRVSKAYAFNPDLPSWVEAIDAGVEQEILDSSATPGIPMEPQLCARVDDIAKVLIEHRGMTVVQPKLDGMRCHLHVWREPGPNGLMFRKVKLYSRTMKDMTDDYPEIAVAAARIPIKHHAVLDGELVALGPDGEVAPFNILQTRLGRKTGKDAVKVGVVVYDLLLLDDAPIATTPYAERLALLPRLLQDNPVLRPIEHEMVASVTILRDRLMQAHEAGEEGLVCKDPASLPEPGTRSKTWVKLKGGYMADEAFGGDTFDLIVIGYNKGRGKRHGKIGALWVGINTPDGIQPIAKVGTGFTDEDLDWWTENLKGIQGSVEQDALYRDVDMDVLVEPEHVVEVQAIGGITKIDKWAGISLRFPAFVRRREDKTVAQATSIQEIET